MTNLDIVKMAFRNLAKRKLRTALTILSVVIGAISIIIMISLGVALDENFDKQIQQMGNITNIEVNASYGGAKGITTENINQFRKIEGVEAVTPIVTTQLRLILQGDRYVGSVTAIGIDPTTAELLGYTALEGRSLSAEDAGTYNMVANPLIAYSFDKKGKGEPYPKWIWSEEDVTPEMQKMELLNQKVTITTDSNYGVNRKYVYEETESLNHKTYKVNIVGIVNKTEQYSENYVIMPIDTLEKIKKETEKIYGNTSNSSSSSKGYDRVIIKCNDIEIVEEVMEQVKNIGEYSVYSPIEYIASAKKTNSSIQILLGAIGGISLFIAAIGITNTMVMAIYERTREIGIMKVIGAKVSDIKRLFLLEAVLIGLLGGAIGVLISHLISFILNKGAPYIMVMLGMWYDTSEAQVISSIPFWLSILSLLFASLIGLMAGYFPAKRAVKIEALKAIKSE